LITLHFKLRLISSFIVGIRGKSHDAVPLILILPSGVSTCKLSSDNNSTFIESSVINEIYEVNNLLGIQNDHSDIISKSSDKTYSIAISRLFDVKTILLKFTFINIFSRIGVVVIEAVA